MRMGIQIYRSGMVNESLSQCITIRCGFAAHKFCPLLRGGSACSSLVPRWQSKPRAGVMANDVGALAEFTRYIWLDGCERPYGWVLQGADCNPA